MTESATLNQQMTGGSQSPDDITDQRVRVFLDRYSLKDGAGEPKEKLPDEMWNRVAKAIGGDKSERDAFRSILDKFKFVPGGRILAGAGANTEVTFYNCYVIPVETRWRRFNPIASANGVDSGNDSREAIFDTIGLMVDIMSRGGGVGINWSVLRPKGAYLKRVNGTSSGPIGWMDVASKAVGEVEQGGSRRGAAMFMLDDWHPDVLDFINAKRDHSRITNANVSVAVSDDFMEAVKNDGEWTFRFPDTSDPAYDAEWDGDIDRWYNEGYPIKFYATVPAREVWRKLAEAAWDNGEPGVVFLDRYNKRSTAAGVERIISVNPCGEQGLGAYSVCNLGAMNLSEYAHFEYRNFTANDAGTRETWRPAYFDYEAFYRDARTATRFLDNVIDKNFYFLPENEKAQKDLRRIGLGVMGLADALIKLGYRYGSPEAVDFTEAVFRVLSNAAIEESISLAKTRGAAPAWDVSMAERPYLQEWMERRPGNGELVKGLYTYGLRNLFLLTQAPTGTTSILAGVNSGIEPFFALGYWREDRTGKHWVTPNVLSALKSTLIANGTKVEGSTPGYVVSANDVTVEEHIAMQAAVQKYVDSSVSKTINAPNSHTVADVERAYTMAYDAGLKGLAYFRDGCGRAQVLYTEKSAPEAPQAASEAVKDLQEEVQHLRTLTNALFEARGPFRRPEILSGRTVRVNSAAGTVFVTLNSLEEGPIEVFVTVGKAGTDIMALGEAIGRLASLSLQSGAPLESVIEQLDGVGGRVSFNLSLPSAVAEALRTAGKPASKPEDGYVVSAALEGVIAEYLYSPVASHADPLDRAEQPSQTLSVCPACGNASLVREEGCSKCHLCGYSAC